MPRCRRCRPAALCEPHCMHRPLRMAILTLIAFPVRVEQPGQGGLQMGSKSQWLPPAALASELARLSRHLDDAKAQHQVSRGCKQLHSHIASPSLSHSLYTASWPAQPSLHRLQSLIITQRMPWSIPTAPPPRRLLAAAAAFPSSTPLPQPTAAPTMLERRRRWRPWCGRRRGWSTRGAAPLPGRPRETPLPPGTQRSTSSCRWELKTTHAQCMSLLLGELALLWTGH